MTNTLIIPKQWKSRRKRKERHYFPNNNRQPTKHTQTQRRCLTGNSMVHLFSSTFNIAEYKRWIFRISNNYERWKEVQESYYLQSLQNQLKNRQIQSRSNNIKIYNISLKQIISTMSITRQFLLTQNRWRWSIRLTIVKKKSHSIKT